MNKIILLLWVGITSWVATPSTLRAQPTAPSNTMAVEQAVRDPRSPFYYPTLFARYQRNDTTLRKEDYRHLYYGQVTAANYHPYGKNPKKVALNEALQAENYAKAVTLAREILTTEPFNLDAIYALVSGYTELKNKEAKRWDFKFQRLTSVILDSGDGLSKETAYLVCNPNDELMVVNLLGLTVTKHQLVEQKWDLLDVQQPNEYNIKQLYFNVEKPLSTLSKGK